eukprot:scaffold367_cov154-Amphora_coffeaeformis.AAC.1
MFSRQRIVSQRQTRFPRFGQASASTVDTNHSEKVIASLSHPEPDSPSKRKAQEELVRETVPPPIVSGDFQVLRGDLDRRRSDVLSSRSALASSLDRMGEHHVRQKEYDEAMDAFSEALQEKRSILSSLFPRSNNFSNSIAASIGGDDMMTATSEQQDNAIDEVIQTLRNMGNVHSLRGEQDEAMRYYTEVTNLRATKSSALIDTDENSTMISGFGPDEDTSTLMSEINEDVKALDDMFRSISFRNNESNSSWKKSRNVATPLVGSAMENFTSPSNERKKEKNISGNFSNFESEPFRRSSSLNLLSADNQLTVALDTYRNVVDSFEGPTTEKHKETLNSLALRVDLMMEVLKMSESSHQGRNGKKEELVLAIEIYEQVLSAQKEMASLSLSDADPTHSARIASTLIRMGSLHYKLGDRLEELRMYEEAKSIYRKAFGENHGFVAGTRKNIGMVLAELGEYERAWEQFEKAGRIYLAVEGGNEMSRDVASAISCMGNVKNRIGELDEALAKYMQALKIYKSIQHNSDTSVGEETAILDVTSTLKVVGMVHAKRGDLDTAMGFFTEAMTLLKTSNIDKTPLGCETSASILTRMGSIYVKKGELDNATDYYKDAYELTVRNRGTTTHQDTASILHYIGGIFHKKADYDEAMNCYQEAIRIYHATLGPCNPAVAGTLVMVGSIHYKRRNLDSAMMFYKEALRLNRDTYGLHHPDVAPILKSIGTILTKKGEYREAYDVFRDVLSIKCTIHGTGDPEVASAYKSLGNVHYKLGELADAERQYRHALSIYRRTRGEDHPDTVSAKTTIEHIRYWMKERGQEKLDSRHCRTSGRHKGDDERSC